MRTFLQEPLPEPVSQQALQPEQIFQPEREQPFLRAFQQEQAQVRTFLQEPQPEPVSQQIFQPELPQEPVSRRFLPSSPRTRSQHCHPSRTG